MNLTAIRQAVTRAGIRASAAGNALTAAKPRPDIALKYLDDAITELQHLRLECQARMADR